jgi:hypothetical protein
VCSKKDSERDDQKVIQTLKEDNQKLEKEITTLKENQGKLQVEHKFQLQLIEKDNQHLKEEINTLKENHEKEVSFLKKCTEKAIDKPSTSVNTLNNVVIKNCLAEYNLTKEMVRKVCERKGTVEHLTNGISGVADLIRPMIEVDGKPMLMMSDASRSCLKYMKDGNIELDSGANMFIQTVKKGAFSPFKTLYKDAIDDEDDNKLDTLVNGWKSIKWLDNEINKKNFLKALHIPSKSELKTGESIEESKEEKETDSEESEDDSEDDVDQRVKPIEEKVEQKIKVKQVFLIPFSLTEQVLYDAFVKANIQENGTEIVLEILRKMIHGANNRAMIVYISETLNLRYIVNGVLIKDKNGELFMNLIKRVIVAIGRKIDLDPTTIIKSLYLPWCSSQDEIRLVS